jgi:SAM-dependent methyltransferase
MYPKIEGYGAKLDLLTRDAAGRSVLHLGAVGETCEDTETRVARASESVHAHLTRVANSCVGVDYDEESVRLLTERGIFHNLLCKDVLKLRRDDIPLDHIDLVVAGDTIEHLDNPGGLLNSLKALVDRDTKLVVTCPNAAGLMLFLRHTAGRAVDGTDHVCSFNVFTLTNLLNRTGWQVERASTCYQPRAARVGRTGFRVGRRLFQALPRLGGTLYLVATLAEA